MTWDLSKLAKCHFHGHHVGEKCPLCDDNTAPEAPSAAEDPDIGIPASEDRSKWWPGPEKELHDLFATWLEHHEVEFVHCRTDQKSTIESGWEDFTCLKTGEDGITRACLVELKNRTGKLRKDQVEVIERHIGRNLPVIVTGEFQAACDFVKTHLAMGTTDETLATTSNHGTDPTPSLQ